jgi:VIT1/CCC1 family predicted Fe2+/Mn2+ transporter
MAAKRWLLVALMSFSTSAAFADAQSFDSPEVSADVAHCAAVFKIAAATVSDEKYRNAFNSRREKLMARLHYTLSAMTNEIANEAEKALVQKLKDERSRDEAQGAGKYLAERAQFCDKTFP